MRWSLLATLPLGLLVAPLVVVLSVFSAWSITAALATSAVAGAIGVRRSARPRDEIPAAALRGLAVVLVAFGASGYVFTGSILLGLAGMALFAWWWLAIGAGSAALSARLALARRPVPALLGGFALALLVFGGGWGMAFARAPLPVIETPRASDTSAAWQLYFLCPATAERRRLFLIERITALNTATGQLRCEYYTWGSIKVGEVRSENGGARWYNGP